MESSYQPTGQLVAACGLYCGACRHFKNRKCPGCRNNEKAQWCKIRQCCQGQGVQSCADCAKESYQKCKKFNNFAGKIFALLFRSDRKACIARIKSVGYDSYAKEMKDTNRQTIKK